MIKLKRELIVGIFSYYSLDSGCYVFDGYVGLKHLPQAIPDLFHFYGFRRTKNESFDMILKEIQATSFAGLA